jgi:hypothetical protein
LPVDRTPGVRPPLAALLAVALLGAPAVHAHPRPRPLAQAGASAPTSAPPGAIARAAKGVTGQGALRFRVALTAAQLPEEARRVVVNAHGGFAVDRRDGRGETYFALPGAGLLRLSADLRQVTAIATSPEMKATNLHNTAIWYGRDGTAFLSFPANDLGRVFTTALSGELLDSLGPPTAADDLGLPSVRDYFAAGGAFVPTDVAYLEGLFYVTTGYSSLDTILTARVASEHPLRVAWYDLAFGGRGSGPGQLNTGHGISVPPGERRLEVADRANGEIDRFTRHGQYLGTLRTPAGSLPCDVGHLDGYAVVAALDGPDRGRGAPIYLYEGDRLVSTLFPKDDLGLVNFQHVHNAVLHRAGGRLYVIAQSWNPGDFAVLEQVVP